MAKKFGKRPAFWLRLPSTADFIDALFNVRFGEGNVQKLHIENSTYSAFVMIERGGSNPCTWFHEDVAIEFARWLSPLFAIWCNDRIKEMVSGDYGIQNPFGNMSAAEKGLIAIDAYSRENGRLRQLVSSLQTRLQKYVKKYDTHRKQRKDNGECKHLLPEFSDYYADFLGQTHLLNEPMKRVPLETIWLAFKAYCLAMNISDTFTRSDFAKYMSRQPLGKVKTNKGVNYFKI